MKKAKIKWIVKRLSYIKKMMKENKVEADFRIGKKKEHIVIDDDVIKVLAIMDEIIENEKTKWMQKCLSDVKKGRKGITIIVDSPFEKGKFYLTKERFINKIYECCIYKGYVSYDDIMNEDIG